MKTDETFHVDINSNTNNYCIVRKFSRKILDKLASLIQIRSATIAYASLHSCNSYSIDWS